MYMRAGAWKGRLEKSVRYGGPGLTGTCEPPDIVAGNQHRFFARIVLEFNWSHLSSTQKFNFDF